MKLLGFLNLVLVAGTISGQTSIKKILSETCPKMESDTSIYSKFHDFTLHLPKNWTGYLEGDNPFFKLQNSSDNCSIMLYQSFDASGIFEWAVSNFDPSTYEILELKHGRILVELNKKGNPFSLIIADYEETEGTWIWGMRLALPEDLELDTTCSLAYIIQQLMK